jgi:carboxyl-terminal processing protease
LANAKKKDLFSPGRLFVRYAGFRNLIMSVITRHGLILGLGLLLGISITAGHRVAAEREGALNGQDLPLVELRSFIDVLDRVKQDYVESVEDKALLENAIRGMLSGLDPHSAYLDKDAFDDLQAGTSGEFGGLGIEVGLEDGFIKVIAPIDDTPAEKAGVKPGDLIIRLDNKPVKGLSLAEAVKMMRGKPNTKLVLTIVRSGEDKPLDITITRDIIRVKSVKSRLLEPGYGYVRVTQFQSNTARSLSQSLTNLRKENDGPLRGLVIDLRNNPGGVLNAAVEVSDVFLKQGTVVYTEGRSSGAQQKFKATPGDSLEGAPLIVLVNGGSASASEIVAGALQDHGRAVIMGEQTFGKGSVQTILPMANGTAVKLTTARYYTPNGRSIQAAGINPDIKLQRYQVSLAEDAASRLVKEADLSRHLENGDIQEKTQSDLFNTGEKKEGIPLAQSDYQLYEALNLLKGLTLLQKSNKG